MTAKTRARDEQAVYTQGWNARRDYANGRHFYNPYPSGTWQHEGFEAGWAGWEAAQVRTEGQGS